MDANAQNFREWKLGLEAFKLKTQKVVVLMIKKIAFEIYKRVLKWTPADKGLLRGAWTISIGSPSDANTQKMLAKKGKSDLTVSSQMAEGINELSNMTTPTIIWFSNAMPYVETVEFGGYPNPPKRGSFVSARTGKSGKRVKGTGQFVIKSVNGFSRQAPRGMLGISILEVVNWIKQQSAVMNEAWTDLAEVE